MNSQFTDADVAVAEATAPLSVAASAPAISYQTALWIARLGRVGALWLPISTICLAHSTNSWAALQATILFVVCWKAALRRSYSDASVTVWTIGSAVPAAVGAVTGALLVTPLAVWAPGLSITGRTLLELTVAVFLTSTVWEAMVAHHDLIVEETLATQFGSAPQLDALPAREDVGPTTVGEGQPVRIKVMKL